MFDILRNNWETFLVGQYPYGPLGGLACTLILAVLGLALAFPGGILLAIGLISPIRPFRYAAVTIVTIVRGLPLVMFIFWAYFLIPVLIGRPVAGFTTMLAALVVYESAYLAEIIRAGIISLPAGQSEAARALGLSYGKTMRKVILPQALYNMLPSMASQFVSTVKETSLGYVISVPELTFAANQVNSLLIVKPLEVYVILAVIYFILCFTLTQGVHFLERRIAAKRRSPVNPSKVQPPPTALQELTKP